MKRLEKLLYHTCTLSVLISLLILIGNIIVGVKGKQADIIIIKKFA